MALLKKVMLLHLMQQPQKQLRLQQKLSLVKMLMNNQPHLHPHCMCQIINGFWVFGSHPCQYCIDAARTYITDHRDAEDKSILNAALAVAFIPEKDRKPGKRNLSVDGDI